MTAPHIRASAPTHDPIEWWVNEAGVVTKIVTPPCSCMTEMLLADLLFNRNPPCDPAAHLWVDGAWTTCRAPRVGDLVQFAWPTASRIYRIDDTHWADGDDWLHLGLSWPD